MRQSISQWLALSGYDTETFASAEDALKKLGPANVIVSLGKEGSLLVNGETAWKAASPAIVEKNPNSFLRVNKAELEFADNADQYSE